MKEKQDVCSVHEGDYSDVIACNNCAVYPNEYWVRALTQAKPEAREEIEKAYGGCHSCYGKGYATTIQYATSFPDFPGDPVVLKISAVSTPLK